MPESLSNVILGLMALSYLLLTCVAMIIIWDYLSARWSTVVATLATGALVVPLLLGANLLVMGMWLGCWLLKRTALAMAAYSKASDDDTNSTGGAQ